MVTRVTPEFDAPTRSGRRASAAIAPQSEMDTIGAQLEKAFPLSNGNKGVAVDRLLDRIVRSVRTTLTQIFAVVVVVLLIACANVSNLLLARASSRTRELGIRAALGASRARVVRQLVTESVLLASLAGVASVLIAAWGVRGLVAIAPAGLPRLDEVHVDLRVLLFAAASSLGARLLFGLAPAFHLSRGDLNDVIKQGGRTIGGGGSSRTRGALIVFETAAPVVLVIGAGLLIRSVAELSAGDPRGARGPGDRAARGVAQPPSRRSRSRLFGLNGSPERVALPLPANDGPVTDRHSRNQRLSPCGTDWRQPILFAGVFRPRADHKTGIVVAFAMVSRLRLHGSSMLSP